MNEKLQEALKKNYAIYQAEIRDANIEYQSVIAEATSIKVERIEQAQNKFFDSMSMIEEELVKEEIKDDMPF